MDRRVVHHMTKQEMGKRKTGTDQAQQDSQGPAVHMAAGGREVQELVLEWHQESKKLDKQALVDELMRRFPRAISVRTGQQIGRAQWLLGLQNVIADLRKVGKIPYERKPPGPGIGGGTSMMKREPTVKDLLGIQTYLQE